jgi:hypothetical protein
LTPPGDEGGHDGTDGLGVGQGLGERVGVGDRAIGTSLGYNPFSRAAAMSCSLVYFRT